LLRDARKCRSIVRRVCFIARVKTRSGGSSKKKREKKGEESKRQRKYYFVGVWHSGKYFDNSDGNSIQPRSVYLICGDRNAYKEKLGRDISATFPIRLYEITILRANRFIIRAVFHKEGRERESAISGEIIVISA